MIIHLKQLAKEIEVQMESARETKETYDSYLPKSQVTIRHRLVADPTHEYWAGKEQAFYETWQTVENLIKREMGL